jgi:hypothetical protein
MMSAGHHGSSALLLVMKVMVWHFVSNSHKVMTAHIVMLPSNCCCWDFSIISKIWVFLCFFFCEVTHQNLYVQICIGNYCQLISCTTTHVMLVCCCENHLFQSILELQWPEFYWCLWQVLKLDKCSGFSTLGLKYIAQTCRWNISSHNFSNSFDPMILDWWLLWWSSYGSP